MHNQLSCWLQGQCARMSSEIMTHQTTDDFYGRLISCIAASAHQHGQKQRDYQMIPQQLLVPVQHEGGHGLQYQETQQPPPEQRNET